MNQDAFEIYQRERHFDLDPVFSSVCALYACDSLDLDSGIRDEVSDSVVLLDFSEYAWTRSNVKSGIMREYHRDVKRFSVKRKVIRVKREVCAKGHLLTPENTRLHNGARTCKTCTNEYFKLWWRRKQKEKRDSAGL